MRQIVKNLEDLLDKNKTENLFLKYREQCGLSGGLAIKNIHRHLVLSDKTYALLYEISTAGKIRKIRLNASSEETRERAFAVMEFLTSKFSGPQFFIPKVYFYDIDYNAVVYENIEGELLINQLKSSNLEKLIYLVALWLKKLHSLEKPNLILPKHEIFFNFLFLKKFYPDLATVGPTIVEDLKEKISYGFEEKLIHGDYQPNNMIVDESKITIFDFNDSQIGDPSLDLAKFLAQLKVMLFRFADFRPYEKLKQIFLNTYDLKFDQNNFQIYLKMYYLQILCSLSASLANDPEAKKTLPEIYKYWEESDV